MEGTGHLDGPGVGQIIADSQHVTTFQLANRGSKAQRLKNPGVKKKILGSYHSEREQEMHCIQKRMHIKGPHRTWICICSTTSASWLAILYLSYYQSTWVGNGWDRSPPRYNTTAVLLLSPEAIFQNRKSWRSCAWEAICLKTECAKGITGYH